MLVVVDDKLVLIQDFYFDAKVRSHTSDKSRVVVTFRTGWVEWQELEPDMHYFVFPNTPEGREQALAKAAAEGITKLDVGKVEVLPSSKLGWVQKYLANKLEAIAFSKNNIDLLADAEDLRNGKQIYWSKEADDVLPMALQDALGAPSNYKAEEYRKQIFKLTPYELLCQEAARILAEAYPNKREGLLARSLWRIEAAFVLDVLISHGLPTGLQHLKPREQERLLGGLESWLFENLPEGLIEHYGKKLEEAEPFDNQS